jgi:hypothetical protein
MLENLLARDVLLQAGVSVEVSRTLTSNQQTELASNLINVGSGAKVSVR